MRGSDSNQGGCVGEWMIPSVYGINHSEKGLLILKSRTRHLGVFEVSDKTNWVRACFWVTALGSSSSGLNVGSFGKLELMFRIQRNALRCTW